LYEYYTYSLCAEHFTDLNIQAHIANENSDNPNPVVFSSGADVLDGTNPKPAEKTIKFIEYITKNQNHIAKL